MPLTAERFTEGMRAPKEGAKKTAGGKKRSLRGSETGGSISRKPCVAFEKKTQAQPVTCEKRSKTGEHPEKKATGEDTYTRVGRKMETSYSPESGGSQQRKGTRDT